MKKPGPKPLAEAWAAFKALLPKEMAHQSLEPLRAAFYSGVSWMTSINRYVVETTLPSDGKEGARVFNAIDEELEAVAKELRAKRAKD